MPGSGPDTVWDTTGPRHLALAGRLRLLVAVTGLVVTRPVADPADPHGQALLRHRGDDLSEFAASERHFLRRYDTAGDAEDLQRAEALAAARASRDLRVLDLSDTELEDMDVLASEAFADRLGLTVPLGRGERATLAVASNRELTAGLDDRAAPPRRQRLARARPHDTGPAAPGRQRACDHPA